MDLPEPTIGLKLGFAIFPLILAALALRAAPAGTTRWQLGVGVVLWLTLTGWLASIGWLADFGAFPPRIPPLITVGYLIAVIWSLTRVGRGFWLQQSLAGLIAFQSFRLPLELMMHRAYSEGLMPIQMSYSGQNFDVVTGALAIPVAVALTYGRCPLLLAWAWNILGIATLLNVVSVAIRSFPGPLFAFPNTIPNVWVTYWPFCWLPLIMVIAALLGHTAITHRLWGGRESLAHSGVL